jgi:putative hemolysin
MVPGTLPVGRLWQLLNQEGTYLAVILGEHGGTAGIVTQEDLLEEVIGEVSDEFDLEIAPIIRRAGGSTLVRGDVLVAEVNKELGTALPTDRANTIGGLLVDELGRMAERGDRVVVEGVGLRAFSVRDRWVEQVAVGASATLEQDTNAGAGDDGA